MQCVLCWRVNGLRTAIFISCKLPLCNLDECVLEHGVRSGGREQADPLFPHPFGYPDSPGPSQSTALEQHAGFGRQAEQRAEVRIAGVFQAISVPQKQKPFRISFSDAHVL